MAWGSWISSILWFAPQMATMALARPGQSQELEVPPASLTWVTGAQARVIGSRGVRTGSGTHVLVLQAVALMCHTTALAGW